MGRVAPGVPGLTLVLAMFLEVAVCRPAKGRWMGCLVAGPIEPADKRHRGFDRPENVDDNEQQRRYEHLRNVLHDRPGVQGRYSFVREFSFAVPDIWREKQWGPDPRFVYFNGHPWVRLGVCGQGRACAACGADGRGRSRGGGC